MRSGGKYEAAPGVQIQQPPPNVSDKTTCRREHGADCGLCRSVRVHAMSMWKESQIPCMCSMHIPVHQRGIILVATELHGLR